MHYQTLVISSSVEVRTKTDYYKYSQHQNSETNREVRFLICDKGIKTYRFFVGHS